MIVPIRTDRLPKRRPVIVEAIITLNVLVFVLVLGADRTGQMNIERIIDAGHFDPQHFHAWQLLTYQFLHDPTSIWHLLMNMLFLWVFGGAVESRLGRFGFACFYLLCGAVAGLAHMMVESTPVIGASGSICGVTGAFLALFPRSRVIVLFLFTLSLFAVPSLWMIGLYFAIDLLRELSDVMGRPMGNTAYMAHLAGYVYGFAYAFSLLAFKVLKRDEFDAFFLFTQMRRRAALRAVTRQSPTGPWASASSDTSERLKLQRAREADSVTAKPPAPPSAAESLRARVNHLAEVHDLPAAAAAYRQLLAESPDSVFLEQRQMDLANQFSAEQDFSRAATAYGLFLNRYPKSSSASQVRLMLGVIYGRHLNQPAKAREAITAAIASITDASQRAFADRLLAEISAIPA